MKYKKKLAKLKEKQNWYDKQSNTYKAAHRRPYSIKSK